jgi:hypothetical protein
MDSSQIAADPSLRFHLDPIERYRETVRSCFFAESPAD